MFDSEAKSELLTAVVRPHLKPKTRHPLLFGFLTDQLTELETMDCPVLAVQRNPTMMARILRAADESEAWPDKGPIRSVTGNHNGNRFSVNYGDVLQPKHHDRSNLFDVLRAEAEQFEYRAGVTGVWYDACGVFESVLRGLHRLRILLDPKIQTIPFCATYMRARGFAPRTVRDVQKAIRKPPAKVERDKGFVKAMIQGCRPAKTRNRHRKITVDYVYPYVGDNGASMAIMTGHYRS